MNSVAVLVTRAPFANSASQDALEMSMVLGSFEVPTALFFLGDAVRQFTHLQPEVMNIKNYTKSFAALPFYDVDALFVKKTDLDKYHIDARQIPSVYRILSDTQVEKMLTTYQRVIRF